MKYSIVIPIYNRPEELDELLESLKHQNIKDFEIIVVEDGSTKDSKHVVEKYQNELPIKYFYKKNEKQGIARNFGVTHSQGQYIIFFDSDCIIPPDYFEKLEENLNKYAVDAWGGPDKAMKEFNNHQKAISYTMTALLTSGKIRSGNIIEKFMPRSFNMGVKREVFEAIGGFHPDIIPPGGEDTLFGLMLHKLGFKTMFFENCFVYHKRRNNFKSFFKQVYAFGQARNIMCRALPETFRIHYLFPTAFVFFTLFSILGLFFYWYTIIPLLIYIFAIFIDSGIKNKSLIVAFLSVYSAFIQHFGYGIGLIDPFFSNYRNKSFLKNLKSAEDKMAYLIKHKLNVEQE